jgi:hypothetical protein
MIVPILGFKDSASQSSLGNALFGETQQAILALLFGHPKSDFINDRSYSLRTLALALFRENSNN